MRAAVKREISSSATANWCVAAAAAGRPQKGEPKTWRPRLAVSLSPDGLGRRRIDEIATLWPRRSDGNTRRLAGEIGAHKHATKEEE